jgi:hypothetical protein
VLLVCVFGVAVELDQARAVQGTEARGGQKVHTHGTGTCTQEKGEGGGGLGTYIAM